MKVAIMQPYFFPYIGQFQLIHSADRFILCDDVQYIRHGWINRNRVLKANDGVEYIVVPLLKHASATPIRCIKAVNDDGWKIQICRQLDHYRKIAPYYDDVTRLLKECLFVSETDITTLNANCISAVCNYIGIGFKVEITSRMNLDYSRVQATEDWALRICEQLGASEYLNPPGGMTLYNRETFAKSNIGLHFVKPNLTAYQQHREKFEPGLSIIDILMFNSPATIREMLNDYQLI